MKEEKHDKQGIGRIKKGIAVGLTIASIAVGSATYLYHKHTMQYHPIQHITIDKRTPYISDEQYQSVLEECIRDDKIKFDHMYYFDLYFPHKHEENPTRENNWTHTVDKCLLEERAYTEVKYRDEKSKAHITLANSELRERTTNRYDLGDIIDFGDTFHDNIPLKGVNELKPIRHENKIEGWVAYNNTESKDWFIRDRVLEKYRVETPFDNYNQLEIRFFGSDVDNTTDPDPEVDYNIKAYNIKATDYGSNGSIDVIEIEKRERVSYSEGSNYRGNDYLNHLTASGETCLTESKQKNESNTGTVNFEWSDDKNGYVYHFVPDDSPTIKSAFALFDKIYQKTYPQIKKEWDTLYFLSPILENHFGEFMELLGIGVYKK